MIIWNNKNNIDKEILENTKKWTIQKKPATQGTQNDDKQAKTQHNARYVRQYESLNIPKGEVRSPRDHWPNKLDKETNSVRQNGTQKATD